MSADNYFLIRKHPLGGYAAVMGFASDDEEPEADSGHRQYRTVMEAFRSASDEYSEYGVSIHEECDETHSESYIPCCAHCGCEGDERIGHDDTCKHGCNNA